MLAPPAAPPRDRAPVARADATPHHRTGLEGARSHASSVLRLLLPICLIAAAAVAAAGLWRVLGRTTPETSSAPSVSLALGPVGAAATAVPHTRERPLAAAAQPRGGGAISAAPAPARVTAPVTVINASGVTGLARRTATALQAKGITIASVGNLTTGTKPATGTVYYAEGAGPQARTLAGLAGAAAVLPAPASMQPKGTLVLVVTRPGSS